MDDEERAYWLAFSTLEGFGPIRFSLVRAHFKTAKRAWHAHVQELADIGIPKDAQQNLLTARASLNPSVYLKKVRDYGVTPLTLFDEEYPALLKHIPDPPYVLSVRGNIPLLKTDCFAIVGTRKATSYGGKITNLLTHGLVHAGFTIVSGLAYGVDAAAHRATLEAGGKTIAVLGCGVDCIYPKRHHTLAQTILDQDGAIVAEAPLSRWVTKGSFPARNRIISGLSQGVLVTEAAKDSGSLITAHLATDQGREVFAAPGPITSYLSVGTSTLIKHGAKLVTSVEDILEEFPHVAQSASQGRPGRTSVHPETHEEKLLLTALADEPRAFDDLVQHSGLPPASVATALSMMELKGLIQSHPDGTYAKNG